MNSTQFSSFLFPHQVVYLQTKKIDHQSFIFHIMTSTQYSIFIVREIHSEKKSHEIKCTHLLIQHLEIYIKSLYLINSISIFQISVRAGSKHHLRTSLSVSSSSEANKSTNANPINKNSKSPSSSGFSSIGNSSCSSGSGSPPGNYIHITYILGYFKNIEIV